MCGIAGVVKWTAAGAGNPWKDPAMAGGIRGMSEALAHRGPDGRGEFVDPRAGKVAALVHRRLAVIDLPCGAQPMGNEDGRVQVVFNGEIYNHAELRAALMRAGHRFATDHSDTEVLVHGWEEWGEELPGKLLGMFAFAVWDFRRGENGREVDTLFLARDRMGQKPLFYASLEDGVAFGSTIPSVLAWPEVPRRLPREQIGLYLLLGYFPAPQTVWRDVHQVLPGAWVRLRGEVLDGKRYWTPMGDVRPEERAAEREVERARGELHGLMEEAVRSQLVSDVPVACFLSGGIDSSIVAALMQAAARRGGGESIRTVSVGFAEAGFDETEFAEQVARKIGSVHTRLEVSADGDVLGDLAALMHAGLGQPFADSSLLPTYQLSKAVRSIAPVALSGDGADELFGGYDRYRAMRMLARWSPLSRFVPRTMPLGSLAKRERYRRLAAAARAGIASERYTRLVEIFSPEGGGGGGGGGGSRNCWASRCWIIFRCRRNMGWRTMFRRQSWRGCGISRNICRAMCCGKWTRRRCRWRWRCARRFWIIGWWDLPTGCRRRRCLRGRAASGFCGRRLRRSCRRRCAGGERRDLRCRWERGFGGSCASRCGSGCWGRDRSCGPICGRRRWSSCWRSMSRRTAITRIGSLRC
ncbi:MAG TPA: asparagine synthase (glutamine-hydrolyzing) [Phycisphaerae bacterium]|nr:asparagine synthase (glutamine-hydrolyzing) [Phycisphaerae bacterium]